MKRLATPVLLIIPTLLSVALAGCLLGPKHDGPANGAIATGRPVAVVDDVKVWTTEYQEKVGEAVHRDLGGNVSGASDVYATRTQVHSKPVWYPVQGAEQISDEDFFRIVGDHEAHEATRSMRSRGRLKLRIGQTALVAGAAASISSLFLSSTSLKIGLSLGGLTGVLGGFYLARSGAGQLEADHHAVPRSRAEVAADRYNARLGTQPALTVGYGGSF
jgi:hypothetical protein